MHRLWHFVSYRYQKLDFQLALDVHEKILDLFEQEAADPQELELLVRQHIDEALEKLFGTGDTSESSRLQVKCKDGCETQKVKDRGVGKDGAARSRRM